MREGLSDLDERVGILRGTRFGVCVVRTELSRAGPGRSVPLADADGIVSLRSCPRTVLRRVSRTAVRTDAVCLGRSRCSTVFFSVGAS